MKAAQQILLLLTGVSALSSSKPSSGSVKNVDTFSIFSETSSEPSCAGVATYTNYEPQTTVYVTVDGDYTVTVTGNGTVLYPTIFYTPPPACSFTLIHTTDSSAIISTTKPLVSSLFSTGSPPSPPSIIPSANLTSSTSKTEAPYANTTAPLFRTSSSSEPPHPFFSTLSNSNTPPPPVTPEKSAATYSIFTSEYKGTITVTVTKKTPVPASTDGPSQPVVQFPGPGETTDRISLNTVPTPSNSPSNNKNSPLPNTLSAQNSDPTNTNNNGLSPSVVNTPSSPKNSNNAPATTAANNPGSPTSNFNPLPTAANNPSSQNNNQPTASNNNNQNNNPSNSNANNNNPGATSSGGLGSIINSAFNSPFTSVGVSTSFGAASATVTLVNGVPVQVNPSSVYIGGSYIALPSASSTALVTINGETFTVNPSQVIGVSTTLTIARQESVSYSPLQAATLPFSTITQNGITITVQPTVAVVSGTTYTIGLNAQPTVLTLSGQTITFDSSGIRFPSTTYQPAMTTASAYVVTTIGKLTFSIDQSEAIISGTTYRIGNGSLNSKTTTIIDGTTVVFGPSGIVLPSTTIAPTGVSLTTRAGSSRTSSATAATKIVESSSGASATGSGNGAVGFSRASSVSSVLCGILMVLAAGMLPLSLIL
ncbi:hypothetical protein H2198_009085 [Neophaeococcomyces mojaviensis]|uniref:Uncharacterized protein n=1 Tax=Neophaeococcomyces mojaviensis TaxID=3383035 RepID=A0ACC2ZVP1_9EURO|nr:hypothetical protein H2198_009085 [Knufia sp. JES_112]